MSITHPFVCEYCGDLREVTVTKRGELVVVDCPECAESDHK